MSINNNQENAGHEIVHEHTVYAEPLYKVGDFSITNSLINSWIVVLLIVVLSVLVRVRVRLVPRGIQNFFEFVMESMIDVFNSVTGDKKTTEKLFPFIFSFFVLILLTNWSGLLPGMGSVGMVVSEHGQNMFVSFMRGGTADVNTTLSLAIIGVVASHIFGVISIGIWNHVNKFVNIKTLLAIPAKIREDKMVLMINPVHFFVGLIELVGEVAKVISLTLRLFGNIFAGEVLLATMSGILAFGLPIPFMFMEVLVGLIQAFIFSILVLSYLSSARQEAH